MKDDYYAFEQRKAAHIALALMEKNQALECNFFDALQLTHEALPDLDFNAISIVSERFGESVKTPFMVSSMTAGHQDAAQINRQLLEGCAASGWAMGVGSQRRELTDPLANQEWRQLRRDFSTVSLFSNLGIAQVITTPIDALKPLIDVLEADALIIHCNPLQEVLQPEGTPDFKGCWKAIAHCVEALSVPVIIKETGCGFSALTVTRLMELGVAAVDVSGLGGTHWGRIEGCRAPEHSIQQKAAMVFQNWGIDTVMSVKAAVDVKRASPSFEVWGSGGVRHGLDAAKLLALGATTVGFAKPMLEASLISAEAVIKLMQSIEYELRVAMFCTGSATLQALQEKACR